MTRAEISEIHQLEWREFREKLLNNCKACLDEKEVKAVKTLADAIRITQDGERRACDFGEGRDTDTELTFAWEGEAD